MGCSGAGGRVRRETKTSKGSTARSSPATGDITVRAGPGGLCLLQEANQQSPNFCCDILGLPAEMETETN